MLINETERFFLEKTQCFFWWKKTPRGFFRYIALEKVEVNVRRETHRKKWESFVRDEKNLFLM